MGRAEWRREGRRESKRRARLTIRERKMTIKGGKGEGGQADEGKGGGGGGGGRRVEARREAKRGVCERV